MKGWLIADIDTLMCKCVLALSADDEIDMREASRDLHDDIKALDCAYPTEVADERSSRFTKGPLRNIVIVRAHKPVIVRRLVLPPARPSLLRVALVDPER